MPKKHNDLPSKDVLLLLCDDQTLGVFTVDEGDVEELNASLDALDELPNDREGYTLSGPGRAAWALRRLIGEDAGQGV